jgi:hypothetical protein
MSQIARHITVAAAVTARPTTRIHSISPFRLGAAERSANSSIVIFARNARERVASAQ